MEIKESYVFQADSEAVNSVYTHDPNYLIEYDPQAPPDTCALYFSSHNIYYPNEEVVFTRDVVARNRFEWYGTRLPNIHKHVFLRDIKKQWYLTGINATVDSPGALEDFLRRETKGFRVTAIGSSAGGYAAVVYGQLLRAGRIYSFNGQFEFHSLLRKSSEAVDPLVFRNTGNKVLEPYYDARNFLTDPDKVYYFHSRKSQWDKEQLEHIADCGIHVIPFNVKNHGIPFLKNNLPAVLEMSETQLKALTGRNHAPLLFSIRSIGLLPTLSGIYHQLRAKWTK